MPDADWSGLIMPDRYTDSVPAMLIAAGMLGGSVVYAWDVRERVGASAVTRAQHPIPLAARRDLTGTARTTNARRDRPRADAPRKRNESAFTACFAFTAWFDAIN